MKAAPNSYGGLNADTAYDSIPNTSYIDAVDVRITTTDGESIGGFTNIKGTEEAFTIPQSGTFNSIPWTASGVAEIIGVTTIRNRIIVFVADDGGNNGWIYDIQYDPATRIILPGFPSLIYYSANLNFKKEFPIEALGKFELANIQRIYWLDYNNYIRTINIEDPNLPTTSVDTIDIYPNVDYVQPLLTNVGGGGSLQTGVYQLAYRLLTADGKETLISPPGNLCPIFTKDGIASTQSGQVLGDITNVNSGKSIQVSINTSGYVGFFTQIELISIYTASYETIPIVKAIEKENVVNGSVLFTYTGTETNAYSIELLEYTRRNYPFKTAKTLTQKDSSLVIANLKGSTFDIADVLSPGETFDSKTRRYRNIGGIITPPFAPGTPIDDLNNAFNQEFNQDKHWSKDWQTNKQYKYQSDGVTLGGEGSNISYKFHLEEFELDGDPQPGYANVANFVNDLHNLNDGAGTYPIPYRTFPNFASPFISGLLKGYKRGETYRFGIVFFNKKGEASFVNYIGDIKFPDISEEDSTANSSGSKFWPLTRASSATANNGYSLGIQFTIDLTSCPSISSEIVGYQIVRLERTEGDKRRLAQGFMKNFYHNPIAAQTLSFDLQINNSTQVLQIYPYYPDETSPGVFNLRPNASFGTLEDQDATGSPYTPKFEDYAIKGQYLGFYSPEISYNWQNSRTIGSDLAGSPSLLITGSYNWSLYSGNGPTDFTAEGLGKDCYDYRTKTRATLPVSFNSIHNIKQWENVQYMNMIDTVRYTDAITGLISGYYMRNYWCIDSYPDAPTNPLLNPNDPQQGTVTNSDIPEISKAGSSLVGKVRKYTVDPITNTPLPANSIVSADYFVSPYTGVDANGNPFIYPKDYTGASEIANSYVRVPILDLLIPRAETYGGYTQAALESNIFIPASPYIKLADLNPIVYGGDIFINMFTVQTSAMEFTPDFFGNNKYRQSNVRTELYPTESCININLDGGATLRTGNPAVTYTYSSFASTYFRQETANDAASTFAYSPNVYLYNPVYSTENDDITYFIKPEGLAFEIGGNDVRAYLSNVKINGELIDSWTQFGANSFYDVDDYGPINKILNWQDTVFFFQDKGVGRYAINRAAITTTADGVPTSLGTGLGFGKHEYLTKESGSIHQWAVKSTESGIYYFDALLRKLMKIGSTGTSTAVRLGNNPLSELKGIHSLLQALPEKIFWRKEDTGDNPILNKGVVIGKDLINDEILFTFKSQNDYRAFAEFTDYFVGDLVILGTYSITGDVYYVDEAFTTGTFIPFFPEYINNENNLISKSHLANYKEKVSTLTLVFDELMQEFSSKYSAVPGIYLENNDILMSPNPVDPTKIHTHNIGNWGEIYGNIEETSLSLVINPEADINKVLRTLEFNSIVRDDNKVVDRTQTITAFRIQTQYQDTGKTAFSPDRIKRKFDKWRVKIPRDQLSLNQQSRLRSTYFILTLYYDNTYNKELIMNKILSYYDYQMF